MYIRMGENRLRAGLVVLLFAALSSVSAQESTVKDFSTEGIDPKFLRDGVIDLDLLVNNYQDLYRADGSTAVLEMTVTKPKRTRTTKMRIWSKGSDKSLIIIDSPAREKGTATLKVDRNLWNYLPRIKRTIRIPPSMMLSSWMGSDLTNDDLVQESSFQEDYTYELVGRSEDPPGLIIDFVAKPGVVGLWKRFEMILTLDGRFPVAARYYDRKNRLARTMSWDGIKNFYGVDIPTRMTIVPADKEGYKTEMTYLDIKFDSNIPDSMFSLSRLEQSR